MAGWRELNFEVQVDVQSAELSKVLPSGSDARESTSLLRDFELLAPHLRTAAIGVIRALALGDPDKGGGTIQMREDQQHYRNHGI